MAMLAKHFELVPSITLKVVIKRLSADGASYPRRSVLAPEHDTSRSVSYRSSGVGNANSLFPRLPAMQRTHWGEPEDVRNFPRAD